MRLAGIAGALVMLVPLLAGCGGNDETTLERRVRTYLESNQRYHSVLHVSDEAVLGGVTCGKLERFALTACEITVDDSTERYFVDTASRGGFAFQPCRRGDFGGGPETHGENDPCEATING